MNWSAIWSFLKARASERSTWVAAFTLITAAGVNIRPDLWDAIVSVGIALASGVIMATPDPPKPPPPVVVVAEPPAVIVPPPEQPKDTVI